MRASTYSTGTARTHVLRDEPKAPSRPQIVRLQVVTLPLETDTAQEAHPRHESSFQGGNVRFQSAITGLSQLSAHHRVARDLQLHDERKETSVKEQKKNRHTTHSSSRRQRQILRGPAGGNRLRVGELERASHLRFGGRNYQLR